MSFEVQDQPVKQEQIPGEQLNFLYSLHTKPFSSFKMKVLQISENNTVPVSGITPGDVIFSRFINTNNELNVRLFGCFALPMQRTPIFREIDIIDNLPNIIKTQLTTREFEEPLLVDDSVSIVAEVKTQELIATMGRSFHWTLGNNLLFRNTLPIRIDTDTNVISLETLMSEQKVLGYIKHLISPFPNQNKANVIKLFESFTNPLRQGRKLKKRMA